MNRKRLLLGVWAVVIVGAVLRLAGTLNDLWLDELISLRFTFSVKHWSDVFSSIHFDNNHYLNTLYMYLLGFRRYWPVYRYLSVAGGVGTIGAGYWLLAGRARSQALVFAGVLTVSYPLIHFSSEARGYSGAVMGSLLAAAAAVRFLEQSRSLRGKTVAACVYPLAVVFGMLSHLTAVLVWVPVAAYLLVMLLSRVRTWRGLAEKVGVWVAMNLLPAGLLAILYVVDVRYLAEFGGRPVLMTAALSRLLALTLGWPGQDVWSVWWVGVPLAVVGAWGLWRMARERESLWLLLVLIGIFPAVYLAVAHPKYFFARYLLVELPFVYLLLVRGFWMLPRKSFFRAAGSGVLVLFVAGQAALYVHFLEVGRGHFIEALTVMAAKTPTPTIRITANEDFRASLELGYFDLFMPAGRKLYYIQQSEQDLLRSDWYIVHHEGDDPEGPATVKIEGQPLWYREAFYPASELSGQAWTVYAHRAAGDATQE